MDLNKEIEEIKKRNKRVELEKAWKSTLSLKYIRKIWEKNIKNDRFVCIRI